jgi:hypothetical protein
MALRAACGSWQLGEALALQAKSSELRLSAAMYDISIANIKHLLFALYE